MAAARTVGIVSEVFSTWERRSPFTPNHVRSLVAEQNTRVLIQPSSKRVFSDSEFQRAGAEVTNDLSDASVIFGVKQVPQENLIANKTYAFFSHTIKAQSENMPLLNDILKKKIKLVDYECITNDGKRGSPRLVAFGEHAGRAGMINALRGLGQRLLYSGSSSPFLNVSSAYMYPNFIAACDAVSKAGEQLRSQPIVDPTIGPLTFVFTGNGNVTRGALEVFKLLPHEMVTPAELKELVESGGANVSEGKVYGCLIGCEDMVTRDGQGSFDKADYYSHPHKYRSTFHEKIAPYTSVLVNGMYWDARFPHLLTNNQMASLHASGNERLHVVADITCDVGGSVEFLSRSSTIEAPLYNVDKRTGKEVAGNDATDSVMMLGVDILPSELPREASSHFGDCLLPFVSALVDDATAPIGTSSLPAPLEGAVIAANGEMKPKFSYITSLNTDRQRSQEPALTMAELRSLEGSCVVHAQGHLFDTGLINQILNVVEQAGGRFNIVDVMVQPNQQVNGVKSSLMLQITLDQGREALDAVITQLNTLASSFPLAEAEISEMSAEYCGGDYDSTLRGDLHAAAEKQTANGALASSIDAVAASYLAPRVAGRRRVALLGAGMVASPAAEYLSRDGNTDVFVASALESEVSALINRVGRVNVIPVVMDVLNDTDALGQLIDNCDAAISLLPQTMHVQVAEFCIAFKKPLVTASYVSPQMMALNDKAKAAGVTIMGEMGLDPGMDHMSAMKVIDEAKAKGSVVRSFSSICGGLPAPEAADNPLGYKFSWSPKGMLMAMSNTAAFIRDGQEQHVEGKDLLTAAVPADLGFPSFALEHLPNRDSLMYGDVYGLHNMNELYRGTLRYAGFCDQVQELRRVGLLDGSAEGLKGARTWGELLGPYEEQERKQRKSTTASCLEWLGLWGSSAPLEGASPMDALCTVLEKRLEYGPEERDMALMQHRFEIENADGTVDIHTSTLCAYGEPGGTTAMAATVGVTAAVGCELMLNGDVTTKGVVRPVTPDIYVKGLDLLEKEGFKFKEVTKPKK